MNHEEWLEMGRKQLGLWPSQPWEPPTMAAAYDLFRGVPKAPALRAIEELSAEGREFSPAPGVVLARALQLVVAAMPRLQDPELTRPLAPEELESARRQAAALRSAQTEVIKATWMLFARHSRSCRPCGRVADRCRQPGLESNVINPWLDDLCSEGRPLFEAWRLSVFELQLAAFGSLQQEAAI